MLVKLSDVEKILVEAVEVEQAVELVDEVVHV
jgi:hypothetical protein